MKASFSLLFMILINLVVFKTAIAETCLEEKVPIKFAISQFESELIIDHSKSISEIEELAGDKIRRKRNLAIDQGDNPNMDFKIDGLTKYDLGFKTNLQTASLPLENGKHCVYVSAMEVQFGVKEYFVYLNKHQAVGTCRYEVIYEHELKHVQFAKDAIQKFMPQLEKHYSFMQGWSVIHSPDTESKLKEQSEVVYAASQEFLKEVWADLSVKNAEIDTVEAYLEESRKCHNVEDVVKPKEQTEEPQMP